MTPGSGVDKIEFFPVIPLLTFHPPIGLRRVISKRGCMKRSEAHLKTHHVSLLVSDECFVAFLQIRCILTSYPQGTPALLSYAENNMPIPTTQLPLYGRFMEGVVVCCTVLTVEERRDVAIKVTLMGGRFVKELTADVTHLVAGACRGEKYEKSLNSSINIVTYSWVKDCWVSFLHSH